MSQEALTLTYGVEMEMVAEFAPRGRYAEGVADDMYYNFLRTVRYVMYQRGFRCNEPNTWDSRMWGVDFDASIVLGGTIGDHRAGLEIQTPVWFAANMAANNYELHGVINTASRHWNVRINDSCGLHVHVGNRQRGFGLRTLKTLAGLLIAFEHDIQTIHPDHRLRSEFCVPLSEAVARTATSWRSAIEHLEAAATIPDLIQLLNPGRDRYFSVNFVNLLQTGMVDRLGVDRAKRTVEFRQHAASLDATAIAHWARICTAIVAFANGLDTPRYHAIMNRQACASPRYGLYDFLSWIGRYELWPYYRNRLYLRQRRQPRWGNDGWDY